MRSRMLAGLLLAGLLLAGGCKSNTKAEKTDALPPAPPMDRTASAALPPAPPPVDIIRPLDTPRRDVTFGEITPAPAPPPAPRARARGVDPVPAPKKAAPTGGGKYVVKKGDTLTGIAKTVYGDAKKYKQIALANHIANPNMIRAGQVLVLP